MTTQLNTLFVTADEARVQKDHEALVVRVGDQVRAKIPLLHLAGVVSTSPAWLSPEAMEALVGQGSGVSFLTPSGRFLARVEGLPGGSVLVRRAQFEAAVSSKSLEDCASDDRWEGIQLEVGAPARCSRRRGGARRAVVVGRRRACTKTEGR